MYSNIAEKFVADAQYQEGTVLDYGGQYEVTLSEGKATTKIAGVVLGPDAKALVLNDECSGEHVAAIALQGKAKVRVLGFVLKGDFLVSNGGGIARRTLDPKIGSIIGRALEGHNGDESLITAAIIRS